MKLNHFDKIHFICNTCTLFTTQSCGHCNRGERKREKRQSKGIDVKRTTVKSESNAYRIQNGKRKEGGDKGFYRAHFVVVETKSLFEVT